MSKPARQPDPAPAPTEIDASLLMGLRVALALAYPLLAHLAGAGGDAFWAALAMADMVLLLLLEPLLKRRAWALLLLGACLLALWWLSRTRYALVPLLAVPVAFIALVGWLFARSLARGRMPLIARIVEGLYTQAGMPMSAELHGYARGLTAAWAALLFLLALANLLLALCAVPSGVLAQLGRAAPFTVTDEQWSIFANLLNYGIVGVFFIGEYTMRKRRFPNRPYRNALQFLRQMAQLGPGFWNGLMR